MNEDVNAMIQEELKGWSEAFDWALTNMDKPITEWPPGWVVVENTDIEKPKTSER